MESRETQLGQSLQRVLNSPDLNLDTLEEDTRAAIRQARMVLATESRRLQLEEIAATMQHIGERVELIWLALEGLAEEVKLKKSLPEKTDQQQRLWAE